MDKRLEEAVKQAYEALERAEQVAEEVGEGFDFNLTYVIGGYYSPASLEYKKLGNNPDITLEKFKEKADPTACYNPWANDPHYGWYSSSQRC